MNMSKIQKAIVDYLNGNVSALNQVYDIYYKKFQYVNATRTDKDEAFSDLNLALTQAIQTYDLMAGVKFNTYFWTCYRNLYGTEKIRNKAKKRTVKYGEVNIVSIDKSVGDEEKSKIGDFIEDKKSQNDLTTNLNRIDFDYFLQKTKMPQREKRIIQGLYDGKTMTMIAEELNVTVPCISQIVKNIKNQPYSHKLFALLKG